MTSHPTQTLPLMTHLVAHFPNPTNFTRALEAMLEANVAFLEIQLPFTNPLADGPTIFEANQIALQWPGGLHKILQTVKEITQKFPHSQTQLILMSYFTPISRYEPEILVELLRDSGFKGVIIPDLTTQSSEELQLRKCLHQKNMYNLPVVSPLTTIPRLQTIQSTLLLNQPIYAMSRAGRTGDYSNLEENHEYYETLLDIFAHQQVCVGFGISTPSQVQYLRSLDIIPVIGSHIVSVIKKTEDSNHIKKNLTQYLHSLFI